MQIEPIKNRIVAKQVDMSQQTTTGIILKQGVQGRTSNVGEVYAVGPECTTVKVGDKVIYIDNMTFDFLGEQYVTFYEHQILGLLK